MGDDAAAIDAIVPITGRRLALPAGPIFTLQRVEGRLFKPMAWTVAFALLGALMFSMLIAPVLASFFFPRGGERREERIGVDVLDQRRQHPVGNVGHKPDVVALEGLQHHAVPGRFRSLV